MNWFTAIFTEHTALQSIVVLSLISALGLILGKVRFFGISLGVTFVFFVGIIAGHFGMNIDSEILGYAQNFGLVLFVYALGLQVGPGFFSTFRSGGMKLNILSLAVIFIGTAIAAVLPSLTPVSLPDAMGILGGAVTNTPALAAEQQTLTLLGIPGDTAALAFAVTYPLGVVGVILVIALMRKFMVTPTDIHAAGSVDKNHTYVAMFNVRNPGIFGRSIEEVARMSSLKFVISRLWRGGKVSIPTSTKCLEEGDKIMVISDEHAADALRLLFGEEEATDLNTDDIDWNSIDRNLISQRILMTRHELNGKSLGSLKLRNKYGVNISRIYRSGVQLLATPDLRLQLGDRLTVVGEKEAVHAVEQVLGNAVKSLDEPNLVSVFIGIVLGLILGEIPFSVPGIDVPVKLGLAGGPIVMGILVGTFGPRLHMITYTTQSANWMIRSLGLSLFLSSLGLSCGEHFFETIFRTEGVMWVGLGFLLTVVPVLIVGVFALKVMKIDFGSIAGMLGGSMANPMSLDYSQTIIPGDEAAVAYASVYPLGMFMRVILVQVVILMLI